MNNRFAVINFSPNLNIRRRTIKLRQLKAMFTFTTLRLHLHTIEYRMPLRGEFRLEIFQFPYWLSNPKFRPPALSFGAQKKFRSESLTVNHLKCWYKTWISRESINPRRQNVDCSTTLALILLHWLGQPWILALTSSAISFLVFIPNKNLIEKQLVIPHLCIGHASKWMKLEMLCPIFHILRKHVKIQSCCGCRTNWLLLLAVVVVNNSYPNLQR